MNKLVVVMCLFLLPLLCGGGVSFAADTGEEEVVFCSKNGERLKVPLGDEVITHDLLVAHGYADCLTLDLLKISTDTVCTATGWNIEKSTNEVYVSLKCFGFTWKISPGVFLHGSYVGATEGVIRHIERVRNATVKAAEAADEAMNNTRNK